MGDRDSGSSRRQHIECSGDAHFSEGINAGCRLVENQYIGVRKPSAQKRHQLTLACTQAAAALSDSRLESFAERIDPLDNVEMPHDALDVISASAGASKSDVPLDRVVEKERFLRHHD